jgi:hypothetical protein
LYTPCDYLERPSKNAADIALTIRYSQRLLSLKPMSAFQSALSSARFNRYLMWFSGLVLAAGVAFLAIKLVPGNDNQTISPDKGFVPSLPAKTLQEFVAYAKANPGKINFGYGQGTTPHLVGGLFKQETGTDISFIPYKGGAQAVADMLGGHIQMNIGTSSTLRPLVRDGRLRALAVTGTTRMAELPEVPTMAESGYPHVTSAIYYGIFGPAGLPSDIVRRINESVAASLTSPELTTKMATLGFEPHPGSPQDFAKLLAAEMKKWLPIVKATGFQM